MDFWLGQSMFQGSVCVCVCVCVCVYVCVADTMLDQRVIITVE